MNTPFHTATSKAQRADSGRNVSMQYSLYKYFYHSDYLGSTSYVTDATGAVSQHVEYVPFGEVFIEERNNTWNTQADKYTKCVMCAFSVSMEWKFFVVLKGALLLLLIVN